MNRVTIGQNFADNRMTGLMIGDDAFFFVTDQSALSFWSHYDTLDGLLQRFPSSLPSGPVPVVRSREPAALLETLCMTNTGEPWKKDY